MLFDKCLIKINKKPSSEESNYEDKNNTVTFSEQNDDIDYNPVINPTDYETNEINETNETKCEG